MAKWLRLSHIQPHFAILRYLQFHTCQYFSSADSPLILSLCVFFFLSSLLFTFSSAQQSNLSFYRIITTHKSKFNSFVLIKKKSSDRRNESKIIIIIITFFHLNYESVNLNARNCSVQNSIGSISFKQFHVDIV